MLKRFIAVCCMYVLHMIFFVFDVMIIYGRGHKVYFDEFLLVGIVFCLSFFLGTFVSVILFHKVFLVIISQIIFMVMLHFYAFDHSIDIFTVFILSNAISVIIVLLIYLIYRIHKRIA